MNRADLSKPQWDAALAAARLLMTGNIHSDEDRAAFRAAKAGLSDLLPDGTDVSAVIGDAVRWDSLSMIAEAFAGTDPA